MKFRYFDPSEFACKCGCGFNGISPDFVQKLDNARATSKSPFVINSGCRCKSHNKRVKGRPDSSHVKGAAADIRAKNSTDRFEILGALIGAGFRRIGVAKNFIHVDDDADKPHGVVWLYK